MNELIEHYILNILYYYSNISYNRTYRILKRTQQSVDLFFVYNLFLQLEKKGLIKSEVVGYMTDEEQKEHKSVLGKTHNKELYLSSSYSLSVNGISETLVEHNYQRQFQGSWACCLYSEIFQEKNRNRPKDNVV